MRPVCVCISLVQTFPKRAALLASLPSGESIGRAPAYEVISPTAEGRYRLTPRTLEGGFEAWCALDELFPVSFQGVNHNRGIEGGIIDSDVEALRTRMASYFSARTFEEAKERCPEVAKSRARYEPEKAWAALCNEGHYEPRASSRS